MIVAIDGPAGAGKSTVARAVAAALGFAHLDTGAMYRALTLAVLDGGLDVSSQQRLEEVVAGMDVGLDDDVFTMSGKDVTAELRHERVTEAVASIAALPQVRAALVPLQRRLAARRDTVVEGRDIGTVVFPDAEVKVYLTASPAERARRRTIQLGWDDDAATVAELEKVIAERDETDASRPLSPLSQADGAFRIDSTDMSFDQVVEAIVSLVHDARDR